METGSAEMLRGKFSAGWAAEKTLSPKRVSIALVLSLIPSFTSLWSDRIKRNYFDSVVFVKICGLENGVLKKFYELLRRKCIPLMLKKYL